MAAAGRTPSSCDEGEEVSASVWSSVVVVVDDPDGNQDWKVGLIWVHHRIICRPGQLSVEWSTETCTHRSTLSDNGS